MNKKQAVLISLFILILISISIYFFSKIKSQLPVLPSEQAENNLIKETSSDNWFFHQENAYGPHGEQYVNDAYIIEKDSGYIYYVNDYHPAGTGSFKEDKFIYNTFGVEYCYTLSVPIKGYNIIFDIDNDGEKELLQDNGKEIFVKKKDDRKIPVHQISEIAKSDGYFLYAPVTVEGLDNYVVTVADPAANGSDQIQFYNYSPDSKAFTIMPFKYPEGKEDEAFYGHIRRTESGGIEGIIRNTDGEGSWYVTFYDITYNNGYLIVSEKYKEPGGWPMWWSF